MEDLSVFNPNAGKYGLSNFRMRILFTQWLPLLYVKLSFSGSFEKWGLNDIFQ